ncbi:MAG: ASCH domain-containing protein [Pyrinomonadaceae bacterium]
MLIKDEVIEKIRTGEITVIFRRWSRPGAKAGGTQMTQGGVVGIDAVDRVDSHEITDLEAREAGYASVNDLLENLTYRDDPIYRIRVYWKGEDPRIALRSSDDLSSDELADIIAKLDKMDRTSKRGEWTRSYLEVIDSMPATYSGLLANYLGISQADFKPWVRKLKALGLTESLEVGYRLSPRGEKVLAAMTKARQ